MTFSAVNTRKESLQSALLTKLLFWVKLNPIEIVSVESPHSILDRNYIWGIYFLFVIVVSFLLSLGAADLWLADALANHDGDNNNNKYKLYT